MIECMSFTRPIGRSLILIVPKQQGNEDFYYPIKPLKKVIEIQLSKPADDYEKQMQIV